jgi:hypothetical protein
MLPREIPTTPNEAVRPRDLQQARATGVRANMHAAQLLKGGRRGGIPISLPSDLAYCQSGIEPWAFVLIRPARGGGHRTKIGNHTFRATGITAMALGNCAAAFCGPVESTFLC